MRTISLLFLIFLSLVCSAQWSVLPSNSSADLKEIVFISPGTGFTCGYNGALLKTQNAGTSWVALNTQPGDFRFIEALNEDTVLLAGQDGFYRTFNGSQTWEHLLPGIPIFDLSYNNAGLLFIKTSWIDTCISNSTFSTTLRYRYYLSAGLGSSYDTLDAQQNSAGQMQFLPGGTGFSFSGFGFYDWNGWHCEELDLGKVYISYNGGFTWQPETLSGNLNGPLFPGWFVNDTLGYVELSIEHQQKSFILRTTDGANSFSEIPLVLMTQLTDLVFLNEFEGYALKGNKIYKLSYLDGHLAVHPEYSAEGQLNDITISPANIAYVAGENGIILSKQLDPNSGPDSLILITPGTTEIQFSNTTVGAGRTEEFQIISNGNMPVSVAMGSNETFKIKLKGSAAFTYTIPAFILQPSQDTIVQVQFTPDDLIDYTSELRIHTNASGDSVFLVHLSGKGILELTGTISEDCLLCGQNISVVGDVIIDESAKVTICPGTTLTFTGPYLFIVNGAIDAEGTPANRIVFTSPEGTSGCKGIRIFGSENNDSTILSYCLIENGYYQDWEGGLYGSGITVTGHERFVLKNCEIRNNHNLFLASALKVVNSNVHIENNVIHHNKSDNFGYTVEIETSTGMMKNNIIYSNDGLAIKFDLMGDDFILLQNLIFNNNGNKEVNNTSAISIMRSSPKIILNTICNNYHDEFGHAINIFNDSHPEIKGNLIFGNYPGQISVDGSYPACNPVIMHNNIEGGWENGGSNIDANPGFISPSPQQKPVDDYLKYDFRFTASSPCYNACSNQVPYIPEKDLADLPRIYSGVPDIGAYEAHFWEQLGPVSACKGDTIMFTITPIAPPPYQYIWTLNGELISSVTGNKLVLENIGEDEEGIYECRVITSIDTLITSGKLYIPDSPVLMSQPPDISGCLNQTLFTTVEVQGESLSYEWINYESGETEALTDTFHINTQTSFSGQYYCRISNRCDIVETSPFKVDVWPEYVVDLGNDTTIRKSSSMVLDAGAGAISYLWDTGDTSRFFTVKGEDYNTGWQRFHVTIEYYPDHCIAEGIIWIEFIDDNSVNEIENEIVNIFPNPSTGVLCCSFGKVFREKDADYFIDDISGKLICRGKIDIPVSGQVYLPDGCFDQGIYFIHFEINGSVVTRKVVIMKK